MKRTFHKKARCKGTYLSTAKAGILVNLLRREGMALNGLTPGVKASQGTFTVIELLVVIASIVIMPAMFLPALIYLIYGIVVAKTRNLCKTMWLTSFY